MGLAEPRRKKKLVPSNHGPSAWSSEAPTSSVGFKLMSSMGWAPGKGLGNDLQGEKDNIKYSLKDDLLGIGAKKEYGGGLWRGTGEVDELYRRLEIGGITIQDQKVVEAEKVEEVKEVKLRGGWQMKFQVGDTYVSSFSMEESEVETSVSASDPSKDAPVEKRNKRKRDDGKEKKRSKVKKIRKREEESRKLVEGQLSERPAKIKNSKAKPKIRNDLERSNKTIDQSLDGVETSKETVNGSCSAVSESADSARSGSRKEKKRKEVQRSEGKQKKHDKSPIPEGTERGKGSDSKKKKKRRKDKSLNESSTDNELHMIGASSQSELRTSSSTTISEATTPADPERPSPNPRNMHRARFLAMKRASVMDQNALREILGVKGQAE